MTQPVKLLLRDPVLFWKKVCNHFSSAHARLQEERDLLLMGMVYANLCKGILKKAFIKVAYAGKHISFEEALSDFGFIIENRKKAYFAGSTDDPIRPFQEILSFVSNNFDVLLLGEINEQLKQNLTTFDCLIFNLKKAATLFSKTLRSIKSKHFLSCLNSHKLTSIALVLCFCPSEPVIIEAGAFQCGTTLFMAKFLHKMGKKPRIYALDTFQGIPKASDEDRKHGVVFDEGMFTQVQISKILQRFKKENVNGWITLVPGLIQETLPKILEKEDKLSFLFLDTDQYTGTKAALDMVLSKYHDPLILIDDSTLAGVDQAIKESISLHPDYLRNTLVANVDILHRADSNKNFSFY